MRSFFLFFHHFVQMHSHHEKGFDLDDEDELPETDAADTENAEDGTKLRPNNSIADVGTTEKNPLKCLLQTTVAPS